MPYSTLRVIKEVKARAVPLICPCKSQQMCICSWKSLGTRLSHVIHSAGSHVHLITLVGVQIGEQEVLEQDRATLCKLLSSLFAAAEKTTECNFLLGKHWSSYQYFRFVWCEGSQIQCNKASKWCLGILLDIYGIEVWLLCCGCEDTYACIYVYYCKLLCLSAGIFRQCSTRLKPLPCLHVHYLSPSIWPLLITLALRVLLFLLLVVAGDVERNPGPPKSRTSEG